MIHFLLMGAVVALKVFQSYRQAPAQPPTYNASNDTDWIGAQDSRLEKDVDELRRQQEAQIAELKQRLGAASTELLATKKQELMQLRDREYLLSGDLSEQAEKLRGAARGLMLEIADLELVAKTKEGDAAAEDQKADEAWTKRWEARVKQISDDLANIGDGPIPWLRGTTYKNAQAFRDEVDALLEQGELMDKEALSKELAKVYRIEAARAEDLAKEKSAEAKQTETRAGYRDELAEQRMAKGDAYQDALSQARKQSAEDAKFDDYADDGMAVSRALDIERKRYAAMKEDYTIDAATLLDQLAKLQACEMFAVIEQDRRQREDRAAQQNEELAKEWHDDMERLREEQRRQEAEDYANRDSDEGWTQDQRYFSPPPDDMKDSVVSITEQARDEVFAHPGSTDEDRRQAQQNYEDAKELYGDDN